MVTLAWICLVACCLFVGWIAADVSGRRRIREFGWKWGVPLILAGFFAVPAAIVWSLGMIVDSWIGGGR